MQNPKVPCYRCSEREVGCHSKCEKYRSWKEASATPHSDCNNAIWGMKHQFHTKFKKYDTSSSYHKKAK